jgi:Thiamine pyrophosphate enzyme, C-terminal TPP binding domain
MTAATKPLANPNALDRRAVVKSLLIDRGDLLIVTGLGSSSYDVMAAGDHPRTFFLWGAMGGAAMVGMGLALARPESNVAVITGDGEQLMGLGSLATIGMQASHTGLGVDLVGVAKSCGFAFCERVSDMRGVEALRKRLHEPEGPLFANVQIAANDPQRVLPPRDGVFLKNRFRESLGLAPI